MRRIIVIFIALLLIVPSCVSAKTLQDLYDQLETLQNEQAKANSNKKLTEKEINSLQKEILNINSSISQVEKDIKNAEQSIIDSEIEIANKKEETNKLLQFLQLSNDENVYLEYIFEADNYTDMIYRYSIVSQLTERNNEIMDELNQLIDKMEKQKIELASKKVKLSSSKDELSSKLITLNANLSELTEEGTTIEQDIIDLKKDINYYQNTLKCGRNQELTSCSKTPSASGWTYPLVQGCVSSEYVGYGERLDWVGAVSGHHGIDLACNSEGTNVYAAALGTVARVVYRSTCGGNMVWVYHTINGTPYTTVYMHLLSISVSSGQTVTTSTVIGKLGGGSTSTKRGGYDRCTTGAHLHFGTAYGHNAYNFNAYSFNPRNVYSFPYVYSGYFSR